MARPLALVVAGVIVLAAVIVRPDPVTWTMRLAFSRDATVSALTAPARLGAPLNLLVVASDSREGAGDLEGRFGELSGARADAILLVRVQRDTVDVLHIPRDLRIDTPDRGVEAIATALDGEDSGALVRIVRDTLAVPVHHYVEIGFAGFASLVDAMGGVGWSVPFPLRDVRSGLELPAGAQTLDGATTLAYVRARTLEQLRDGAWQPLPDDDLARVGRQQELLGAVVARALDDPPRLQRWLDVARDHVRTDPTFTVWSAAMVGRRLRALEAEDVSWLVLPVTATDRAGLVSPFPPPHLGGRYWLELDVPAAERVLAAVRDGDPARE